MTAPETVTRSGESRWRTLVSPRLVTAAILLAGLFLLAFSAFIQDLGWFVWGAQVALGDGKLYRDFVEMNAPMIMVLNVIPQWVAQATGISSVLAYDAFIAVVLALSLWVTRRIYRGTEIAGQGPAWAWVLPALLVGFVVVAPSFRAWGQREYITAVLILPYLALALERVHGRPVSRGSVIAAAVMCAVGIGIKPHFIIPLAAIEGFVASRLGLRRAAFRLELIIVGLILTAYLVLSFVLWPEYFQLMRGLGGSDAYAAFLPGRFNALFHLGAFYGTMSILVSLAVPPSDSRRALRMLLMLTVGGFLLAAVVQQKGFDYHLLPTFVFSTALFLLTLSDGGARRRLVVAATTICMLLLAAKVGSRALRTARMVVSAPGTHLSHTIDVIDQYAPHGDVLGLSLHLGPFIPAITYTGADWGSAFSTVWPLITAYADQRTSSTPIRYHRPAEMRPLEKYMFDRMITDMVARPPDLIVFRRALTDELYGDGRFNYLQYFSQDERFRKLFANYRLLPIDDPFLWYARSDLADKRFTPPRARRFGTRWSVHCDNCLE